MLRAILLGLVPAIMAVPAPAPAAEPTAYYHRALVVRAPEPTAVPDLVERGVVDDVETYIDGLVSDVKSSISSLVNSGILDFHGFPTGTQVEKTLGVSSSDLASQPTQVLNIP